MARYHNPVTGETKEASNAKEARKRVIKKPKKKKETE